MRCDCLTQIDKELAPRNLRLNCTGMMSVNHTLDVVIVLDTEWIDKDRAPRGKKNRPPHYLASHCPFCGKPVEDELPAATESEVAA